ncbi:MAG: bifunctional metallophosphatase/5'-nucleotidase [Candidatus Hydrogenedentes bacterium]|jgi:5'-nucleotidase|nr:bifunctional metallophosphatase/5'-nucleotidase [Candidatus Hydrogenedentota bacterium]
MFKKISFCLVLCLFTALSGYADTSSVLILYTSDIHDNVKPGPAGIGGLPYVAGYVADQRKERDDILLLDGGDVMEKGDMISYATQSTILYEAMKKIGYDAGAIGNHDFVYSVDHFKNCSRMAGMTHLCLNYVDESGAAVFPVSKVFDIKGTKIGVIGMTIPKGKKYLDLEETGDRLAVESARLKTEGAHLVIVVAHLSSRDLAKIAPKAPDVALFFGGHSHELLQEPRKVPETGAEILMAGSNGRHVISMDLVVDCEKGVIADYRMEAVEMAHDRIQPDEAMIAWILEEEARIVPEANEVVGHTNEVIQPNTLAQISAEGLRSFGKADIAFCHAGQIMRSNLAAGGIDKNALYRAGGQRGEILVYVSLTGAQIKAYLEGLATKKKGQTSWAGFDGKVTSESVGDGEQKVWTFTGDLDLSRTYKVLMPELEWAERFDEVVQDNPLFTDMPSAEKADFTYLDAVSAYVKDICSTGQTLDAYVKRADEAAKAA